MKEKIEKLLKYYEELQPLATRASNLINQAKEGSKDRKGTVRKIKKTIPGRFMQKAQIVEQEVDIPESVLWQEVWHGAKTDARDILREKYPEVFEIAEKHEKLKKEMIDFTIKELHINPEQIEFGKLITLILNLIDYKLDKNKTI